MKLIYNNNNFSLEEDNKIVEITTGTNVELEIPLYYNIHSHLGENVYKDIEGDDWTIQKYLNYTFDVIASMSKDEFSLKTEESFKQVVQFSKDNLMGGICASRSAVVCNKESLNNLAGYPIMKVEGRSKYLNDGINGYLKYKEENENDNCKVGVSIHSLYTNTKKELLFAKECFDHADFLTIHISEDEETREKEIKQFNLNPLQTLEHFGLLSNKTIIVHCGHLDNIDLDLVKKYDVTIAICPMSNVFLNTKILDVYKLNEMKIKWCIATDGLATGRSFSLEEQALYLKDIFNDLSYEELYKRVSFIPKQFFNNLSSYNDIIKIRISFNNKEDLFDNILNKKYEII